MGAVARGDLLDLLPENFDRVIGVNLRGTIFLTQAVARWMLAHPAPDRPRSIVHVTSVSAALASPERLDYCISKAGLAMWSKGLALRLAPEGIAVFDVRPGIIRTDMTAGVAETYDRMIADGLVPARRWGERAGRRPGGGGARPRRVRLRHRQRDRRRRRARASRGCDLRGARDLRLHHHRRRAGRLRAGQPAERRPRRQGAAARGRRLRLAPVLPHAGRLRQDDQGHRQLGLVDRAAEAPERTACSGTPRPR